MTLHGDLLSMNEKRYGTNYACHAARLIPIALINDGLWLVNQFQVRESHQTMAQQDIQWLWVVL